MLGMLKKYTVELSPTINGQLSNQKIPITNQKVIRSLLYGDEEYVDETITDAKGRFSFTEKSIKSKLPGNIFHEDNVQLYITTNVENETYLLWFSNQNDIIINLLYVDYLNTLVADITSEEESFRIYEPDDATKSYQIHSICRW
ncbi:hypothetical protein A9267_14185 [Shewanella sp. UCD-FRSSP16_17]|uniref:DUF6795 domain-containing protein n=1 Tax=Shewanella sp. UCD-FRSSP16_17 TaxID=1853256 RepID=UPI0007EEB0E9|nr:DUF6795 domain-containing protein [Shewanella sp. UCD-FRSSP16_17]OBT07019.1 hypothetical protein A9267_14185 [Shewanella sp. UCD-FRSSP16_17]